MHVAVDAHNLLTDRRGIGVYLRAVLYEWYAAASCEVTALVRHPLPLLLKRRLCSEIGVPRVRVASRIPRDAAVVWHPWNGTFFDGGKRNVATMHDVVPFAYPNRDPARRDHEQKPFLRSAQRADAIITDSRFSAGEIQAHLAVAPDRISVVQLAADAAFSPGTPAGLPSGLQPERYVLYVGTLEQRKNVAVLVEAWREALRPRGIALAIVSQGADIEDATMLRDVSTATLRDLYRGALAVAQPSLYEGFGLTALEALACAAPLIAARASALPEVASDAAYYVDAPTSVAAWSAALQEIADPGLRATLRAAGPARAARFSWRRTAAETLRVLQRVAAG